MEGWKRDLVSGLAAVPRCQALGFCTKSQRAVEGWEKHQHGSRCGPCGIAMGHSREPRKSLSGRILRDVRAIDHHLRLSALSAKGYGDRVTRNSSHFSSIAAPGNTSPRAFVWVPVL